MRNGDRKEYQALANEISETDEGNFLKFLAFLGSTVLLKNWDNYRGGLDVTNNLTGEKSVYYKTRELNEIMFHIGPFLPSNPSDAKQVQKVIFG